MDRNGARSALGRAIPRLLRLPVIAGLAAASAMAAPAAWGQDSTAPLIASIERQTPSSSPTNADSVTWRILFTETVVNVDTTDFSVSGTTGSVTDVTNSSGNFWDVTVSGGDMASLDGTVTLTFDAGQNIEDSAGNALTNTTPYGIFQNTYVIDNTAPRVTQIQRRTEATTNGAPRWTVRFNEDVSNMNVADFTVSGTTGTLSRLVLTSTALDMDVTGGDIADLNGTVTLSFAGGQDITDLAGNALTNLVPTGLNEPSTIIDNIAPTVVVNIVEDDLGTGETSLVTFEFSEPMAPQGFSPSGTGGTVSNFTQVDADSWTANFTLADGAAEGRVDIDDTVYWDLAFNPGVPGSDTVQRDVTPPVLTAFARNTPFGETTDADTLVFDIIFNENMLNVSADDFLVTGTTTVGWIIAESGAAYTLTLSGGDLANFNGTVGLNLAPGHDITDAAGIALGAGEPSRDETYTVLNSAPRIASIERQSPATSPTSADSLTWRVTFETDVTYTPPGAVLTNTDNVTDDATLALDNASWVAAAEVNGTDYVFVIGYNDSGVSVFSAASDGTLTHVETVVDDGTLLLDGASSAETAVVAGTTYLFVTGTTDSGVSVFSVANDGTLTNVDNVADDGTLLLDGAYRVHTAVVDSTTYLFVASLFDSGVSVFSVANDGTLTNVENVADDATLELWYPRSLDTEVISGTTYLFVAGTTDDGISVFSVANDGTLTNVFNVADGPGMALDAAYGLTAVTIDGRTYLYVAAYRDDRVQVFEVNAAGQLNLIQSVIDDGSLELEYVIALTPTVINNQTYLIAAGTADSGISLFSVANDGTLTSVQNIADDATLQLYGARSGAMAVVGDQTFFIVVGGSDDGVSVFSLAPDGAASSNFAVAGTTAMATETRVSSSVIDVTASGGDLAGLDGTVTLSVSGTQDFADLAGNALTNSVPTGTNDNTFVLDRTGPRVSSIERETNEVILFQPRWTVRFNENVANLDASDFTVDGIPGSMVEIDSGANFIEMQSTVAAFNQLSGTATLAFAAGQDITDTLGNALTNLTPTGTNQNTTIIDRTAPTIVVNIVDSALSDADNTSIVTFEFSEPVMNFVIGDASAVGGSLSLFNVVDQDSYSATFTADDNSTTQGSVTVGANSYNDAVGNGGASGTDTVTVDTANPALTAFARNTPASSTTNADTLVWDVTFDEAVQNVSAGDFTIVGTTATGVLAGSDASYTLTVSGGDLAGLPGNLVRLNLAAGQDITDLAGNALPNAEPATDETWLVDNTAPVLSEIRRNTPASETTDADTLVFALTFNSLMNGVAADDFTVSGTTATASITSGADGDALYQLTLSGGDLAALNNATVGIALSGSADATDTAGNTLSQQAPDTIQTYTMSNPVPPAVSLVFNTNPLAEGGVTILSFIIDNTANLVGATALDLTHNLPAGVQVSATPNWQTTCTGGTVTAVAGSGTISLTGGSVAAGASCIANVDVTAAAAGSYVNTSGDLTSSLGNSGTATATLTVIDATAPRIASIERTTPASSPTGNDTLTWTLTFDEPVELETDDLTLTGSTAGLAVSPSIPPDLPETSGAPVAPPPAVTDTVWTATASGGDLADLTGTVTLGFTGPVLTNTDNVDDDDDAAHALTTARAITTHTIGGVTYLFVGGGGFTDAERGFSVFSLDGSGAATFVTAVSDADDPLYRLFGVYGLAVATINGDHFVYALGRFESGMSVFQFDEVAGTLTNVQNIANSEDPNTFLSVPNDILYADMGAGVRILAVGSDSAGFSTWTVGNDGLLTSAFNFADDETVFLNRPLAFAGAVAGGLPYIVTGSRIEAGLSTFALGLDGSLTHADNLGDSEDASLHLGAIDAIDTEIVDGTLYIYVASSNIPAVGEPGGISVFTLAPGGILTNVFNVSGASVGYSNVSDLNGFYLDGSYYVAVRGTDVLAVYHANADGSLTLAEAFRNSDNAAYRFGGSGQSHVFDIGADPHLAIAGSTSNGFSLFSLANGAAPEDATGNPVTNFAVTGTNEPDFELDNAAPLLTSIERQSPSGQNIGASVTEVVFRASFSEDLSAAPATGDFSVTGDVTGTVSDVTAVTGSSVFDVTVGSLSGEGVLGLSMTGSISDDAGNVTDAPVPSTTETYERDTVAPQVASIENYDPTDNPTNADAVVWRVTFDEAVSNLNTGDFEVSGTTGTLSQVRLFSNRIEMRLSGGDVADGDIIASLAFAAGQNITDQHGNALTDLSVTGTNDNTWTIDNAPPAIDVIYTDDTATASATLVTWDISFFENQTGLTIDDFTLTPSIGVTASDLQISVDNGTNVQVTANLTGNGTAQLSFNANSPIIDDLGNGNGSNGYAPAYSDDTFSVATVDTAPPLVASIERQSPASSPTNASSVTWRILFSETMVNVDVSDFAVSGTTGTVTNVTNPSGNFWDVSVTGGDMGGLDGTITLNFAGGQNITDAAGNALTNTTPYGIFQNTYVLDISAPFITAFARNTPAGEKTNADTLVFDIAFSEAVTNVSVDDFDITGTTATGVLAGSGSAYTLTLSGGDLASYNGIVGIDLAAGQDITDLAGNAQPDAEPATDETYDVRHLAPALASITRFSPASSPTNADSLVWDLSFSAIDSTLTLPASAFTVSGTTATVTDVSRYSIGLYVTVSGGDLASLDGDVTLALADTDFADDYGNVMDRTIPGGAELTYTLDNTAPSITAIQRQTPSGETTNSDALVFAITFSESVANVSADDFNTTGTTATGVLAGSGADYTLTLSGGDLAGLSGVVGLTLSGSNDITDAVGNAVSTDDPATNETYTLDNAAPLVASIVRQSPTDNPTNARSVTWRVTFSETVSGLSSDDFSVSGTTATLSAGNVTATSVDVTASGGDMSSLETTISLAFSGTQDIADSVGNALTNTAVQGSDESSWTIDTIFPTVTITGPAGPVSGAFTATFTFSEDVTGFGIGGITVGNGAASDHSGSGAVYTATITPAADGSVTIDVPLDVASDAVDNGNLAATQFSVTNDETAPTVTIAGPSGPVSGAFTATFTFSEDVTDFDLSDILLANGSASDLTGSGSAYSATITPDDDGDVTINVVAGRASDEAGNGNAAATPYVVTNDETAPTLAISGPSGPVSGAFTATFTFSEDVEGFDLSNVVVGNGSASGFASLLASQYTATITPDADGSVTVDVAGGAAADAAGNDSAAASQFSVTNDETAPTLAITGPAGPVSGAFTATFTFSEDVSGFELGEITVSNGVASGLSGSGALYTATITPDADGSVTVDVAGGAAADAAGNDSAAASQFSVTNDETAPTLAITGPSGLVSGAFTATFTFNEDVTDFALDDIAVTNGAASILAGSGSVYTATITPGGDGLVTVGVGAGAATDTAGNDNSAATPFVVTNDETAPTVTVTGPAGPVTAAFTANFDFSEPVTDFALGDITVGNGSASNLTGSDASYTATITPSAAGQVSVNVATGAAIDAAGNDNLAATAFSVVFDPEDRRLSVTFSGLGSGRLTSSPAGLDCTTDCFADFDINTSVRVTATALPGSVFRRWTSGPCAGTRNGACIIPLSDDTEIGALFSLEDPVQGRVVTAVLPGARSSYVGGPVMTAYLTAVSAAGTPAQSCYISTPSNAPVTMTSQRLDAGGAPTGPLNPVFDLEAGGSASFVLAMTPTTESAGYNLYPLVNCTNIAFDPVPGVNSILITIDDVPVPDILSIGATPSGDGVIRIPASGRAQVMTAAAVNIGAGDGSTGAGEVTLIATVDTGEAVLPISLEMCQIDAAAQCITPRGPSVTANMPANTPLFFATFVRDTSSGAGIAFDPANARVFMRFADAGGTIRSVASAAVTAPAAADLPVTSMVPEGRWSVLMRREDGGWPGLVRTSVHVAANGVAIVDDGVQPRLAVIDPAFDAGAPGRFRLAGTDGRWTSDGMIRLGAAWANTPGEFWGVRDARADSAMQWRDLAGAYGGSVHILDTGEIRGVAGSCAVYGQASGPASSVAILSLTGCAMSGSYAAVIDLPANDNEAPVLIIAGQSAGWRLAQ